MSRKNLLTRIVHPFLTLALVVAGLSTIGPLPAYAASVPGLATRAASAALPGPRLSTPAAVEADTAWSIETVDGGAGTGNYSSLRIDPLDHLHVGYYDLPDTSLKYARWSGGGWITESVDNSASVGQYPSLDLDESNLPHISYYDLTNSALKYTHWNGSAWTSTTVDNSANVGSYTSLVYLGQPRISYHDETNAALKYAHWDGSAWISTTVDSSASVGQHTSLALRGTGPRISYRNATSNTLRYAVYQAGPGTWHVADLTGFDGGGSSTSMAVDSSGYEHISHFRGNGEVLYTYQDPGGWHHVLVEAASGEFVPTSLALDDDDRPHIAYVNGAGMLRYATFDGLNWEIETVDGSGNAGGESISLALDGDGYPHITYQGATGLRHAWLQIAPDLVVTDIWDDGGQIWYQVHNIGPGTARSGHQAALSIDGLPVFTDTVPVDLAPDGRYAAPIAAWSCSGGSDDLHLTADAGELRGELDETNNVRQESWNCDRVPPQITQLPLVTQVQVDSAVIQWGTDENSDSRVYFSRDASTYTHSEYNAAEVTEHQVTLTGLTPATAYRFMVESTDPSGNRAVSDEYSFETAVPPSAPLTGTLSIVRSSGDYPAYEVTVSVSNAAASGRALAPVVDMVALNINQMDIATSHTPSRIQGGSAKYDFVISPHELGMSRDDFFVHPADPAHSVGAEIYSPDGFSMLVIEALRPVREEMPVDLTLWTPADDSVYYADGTGTLPAGTTIPLAAEAIQYEWECEWSPGSSIPNCGDVAHQMDEVKFKVDGAEVHVSTSPTTGFLHTYDFDASGLGVGTHQVAVVAYADDGGLELDDHYIHVEAGTPDLQVSRNVTRNGNYLEVQLTLTLGAGAAGGIYLDYIQDWALELMPVHKSTHNYGVHAEYPHCLGSGERMAEIVIDFRGGGDDFFYLAPGASWVVSYDAVPILYEDGVANPEIGNLDVTVYYTYSTVADQADYALPWQSLSTVQDAVGTADYILVTNPTRLHSLYASDDVDVLLSYMAHLATIRNGVLGDLDTYAGSGDILRNLTRSGGYWAEALNPAFKTDLSGYMLIVGETEVVPAWDSYNFDICWNIPDDIWHCRVGDNDVFHHDQWYSTTAGDGKPELVVGRAIGDSAALLAKPLSSSIAVHEGWSGYYYQAPGRALLVSGRGQGVNRFKNHVNVVGSLLDDGSGADDWNVDILHLPDTDTAAALQAGLANGISLLHLIGHGNVDSWGGADWVPHALVTGSPPYLHNYRPFVFAAACLTGNYEAGDDYNLAESLFDQGVATYIGATQVSPLTVNLDIASRFYGDNWDWEVGEALGHAFGQAERYWYNEAAWYDYDWWKFWVVEYNFYGDPKFGASGSAPMAPTAPASARAPTTTLQVEIPNYVVSTTVDGFDLVDIPGGNVLLEEGLHRVPYWSVSLDYAPGYRVQDVELTLRAGRALTTGLILPTGVMTYYTSAPSSGGPTQTLTLTEDDDWFPAQDEIYRWHVSQNPDGSSVLTIQVFPFHYQPATTNAEWHSSFSFDIDVISTSVAIESLELDGSSFAPGDPVPADLWVDNSGDPLDVVVAATVRNLVSGETVAGVDLRMLHGVMGPSTYGFEWDSSGFDPGQYLIWVDLLDSDGNWLDSASVMFPLGIAAAEITAFGAAPDFFRPGDTIDISMAFDNTGSVPLSGEAIIHVQTADGATTVTTFSHPVTDLAPGAGLLFNDIWDTSGTTEKDYRVLGYVKYASRTSEIETVTLTTQKRIFLPVVVRSSP